VDVKYTHLDEKGVEVESVIASEKKKEDEKEEGTEKKKKKVASPATSTSPVLQNNPFAPVKQASGIQSQQEIQAKLNAKKGEQRNLENNELQKDKKKPSGPVPIPTPPQKSKKDKEKRKKELRESSSEESSEISNVLANTSPVASNPQPYIMGAFAIALLVVGYVFFLG